jgi:hypothetical protein
MTVAGATRMLYLRIGRDERVAMRWNLHLRRPDESGRRRLI